MARTQAADYDKKRDSITAQAAKLFARRGFAGASVSELAAECNVSKSLIYHYYASKEAILFDVMNDHMESLLAVAEDKTNAKASPEEELKLLTRDLLRCYVGAADQQKILLYELSFLPEGERKEIIAKQRKIIARVEDIFTRATPALKNDKARLRARVMLYFGMLNWTHTWFKSTGPMSRDALADEAAEAAINSLMAP